LIVDEYLSFKITLYFEEWVSLSLSPKL